jgi:hypothetical protein
VLVLLYPSGIGLGGAHLPDLVRSANRDPYLGVYTYLINQKVPVSSELEPVEYNKHGTTVELEAKYW